MITKTKKTRSNITKQYRQAWKLFEQDFISKAEFIEKLDKINAMKSPLKNA